MGTALPFPSTARYPTFNQKGPRGGGDIEGQGHPPSTPVQGVRQWKAALVLLTYVYGGDL